MVHVRLRKIGMQTSRGQLVVHSPPFILSSVVSHLHFFLDSPEISPGVLITAASSSPTPSPSGASSTNTGFIVAGIVGGLAVITIAAVVIFFLRRQRMRASSDKFAAITGDTAPFAVGGAPQPMKQGRNALADNVTLGSLPIPDSPTTPMGVYVSNAMSQFSTFLFISSLPCTPRTQIMPPRCPSLKTRMLRTALSKHFSNSTRPQEIPLLISRPRDNECIETVLAHDIHPLGFAVKLAKARFSLFD